MKHPLFVGYFDDKADSSKPRVIKEIHIDQVLVILQNYCDKNGDGTPVLALSEDGYQGVRGRWLGQIEKEDVIEKHGYLVCPWLGLGFNTKSIQFICELYNHLNMQIFDPGDRIFYSPLQLDDIVDEFYNTPG